MLFKWIYCEKTVGCCLCFFALTACDHAKDIEKEQTEKDVKTEVNEDVKFKQDYEVAPEMQDYPIYEIGSLIKKLMLDKNQQVYGWDHLANDEHIQWITQGYDEQYNMQTNTATTRREGLVRIHVLGERVAILRDRNYEAPWQLTYQGKQSKLGVTEIDLYPTGDFQTFPDPVRSLRKQNIKAEMVCEQKYAGERTAVYWLQAKNKQEIFLVDQTSTGSGGSSRWLTLAMQDKSTEWCPDDGVATEPEI